MALATRVTGSATVTAFLGDISGTTVLSTSPLASIAITPASPPSIAPGTTRQLIAMGRLEDNTMQDLTSWATWSSYDPGIADVRDAGSLKGLVTAGSTPGSTSIGAGYAGISSSVTFTTSAVASIHVSPSSKDIPNGTKQQFSAAGRLADSTSQDLTTWATWASSNTAVATISNAAGSKGLASSVSVGIADITAMFSSVTSTTATLTVTAAVLESIDIIPVTTSLPLGKKQQFTAIGTYSNNDTADITSSVIWSSTNPASVTISNISGSKGMASSLSEGTSTIMARLSGITSNSASVTVTQAQLESIVIAPSSASIRLGANQQFTAIGIYTDDTTRNVTSTVTWNSSIPTIADISNAPGSNGLALPNEAGATDISADLSGITSNIAALTVTYY